MFRKLLPYFVSIISILFPSISADLDIHEEILNNSLCKRGLVFRARTEQLHNGMTPTPTPTHILIHFTAGFRYTHAVETYYDSGVSANYTLDENAIIHHNVDESQYVAFHAGQSCFAGVMHFNHCAIGIEHVNLGYKGGDAVSFSSKALALAKELFGEPERLPGGDDREWYPFNKTQFQNSARLTAILQKRYKIPAWNVLTHADVSVGRKPDSGPMYNYKMAFEQYGAGYYPANHNVNIAHVEMLTDQDYLDLLHIFGYKSQSGNISEEIWSFQAHYAAQDEERNFSGKLESCTKKAIFNMCVDLHHFVDRYTLTKHERFINEFDAWRKAKGITAFEVYISTSTNEIQ